MHMWNRRADSEGWLRDEPQRGRERETEGKGRAKETGLLEGS